MATIRAKAADAAGKVGKWAAKNPATATCAAVAGVGVVCVVAPMAIAGAALGAAGFGAEGVAAASFASGIQSRIGSVAAGSLFATLQSAGAGGAVLAVVASTVQAVGGVIAGTFGACLGYRVKK